MDASEHEDSVIMSALAGRIAGLENQIAEKDALIADLQERLDMRKRCWEAVGEKEEERANAAKNSHNQRIEITRLLALVAAHELRIKTLDQIVANEQAARGELVKDAVVWKDTAEKLSLHLPDVYSLSPLRLKHYHAQALQEYEGGKL